METTPPTLALAFAETTAGPGIGGCGVFEMAAGPGIGIAWPFYFAKLLAVAEALGEMIGGVGIGIAWPWPGAALLLLAVAVAFAIIACFCCSCRRCCSLGDSGRGEGTV